MSSRTAGAPGRRRDRGAVQLGVVLTSLALVGGAGAGFAAQRALGSGERADGTSASPRAALAYAEVSSVACPGGQVVAILHHGDRVLVTARHDVEDDWVRVRNPERPDDELWVLADSLAVDDALGELPTAECGEDVGPTLADSELAAPDVEDTTTTAPDETTTVPDDAEPTTSLEVAAGDPSTTRPTTTTRSPATSRPTTTTATTTTTTTTPSDTAGPTIGTLGFTRTQIWEDTSLCSSDKPHTSEVAVGVSDPSGVAGVVMQYQVAGGASGSKSMAFQSSFYRATLGPIANAIPGDEGQTRTVTVTIRATDTKGNVSTRASTVVSISDCAFG